MLQGEEKRVVGWGQLDGLGGLWGDGLGVAEEPGPPDSGGTQIHVVAQMMQEGRSVFPAAAEAGQGRREFGVLESVPE